MILSVLLIIPMFLIIFNMDILDNVTGIILGQLILILLFQGWMLKGYFDNIPIDLDEAARIDGCSIFQRLIYVILPVALPGIRVAAFFSFVVSWVDFLIVSVISPSLCTATVTLVIQRLSGARLIRWGQVTAVSVLTIIPTIILFFFVQNRLVLGLTAGAVKGD